jgi:hypothetical protein
MYKNASTPLLSVLALGVVLVATSPVVSAENIYIGALVYAQGAGFAVANWTGPGQQGFYDTHTWVQIDNIHISVTGGSVYDYASLIVLTGTFSPTTVTYYDNDDHANRTVNIEPNFRVETHGAPWIGSLTDGFVASIEAQPAAVPEPATWTMGGLAIAGFVIVRYKRARQRT